MFRSKSLFINLTAVLILCAVCQAQSPDASPVTFDFSDVEIRSFIKIVSELTGKNYVVDSSVAGKITVTSPHPIPKEAIPSVFQAVLDTYGYSAVADGEIIKIVPAARAKQEGTAMGAASPEESVATRIVKLQNATSTEIQSILSPLLTRAGHLASHAPSNTIILTDVKRNLDRLAQILSAIDRPGVEYAVVVHKLEHAQAETLSDSLSSLYGSKNIPGESKPVFIPEPRTNALLIAAPASMLPAITNLAKQLDEPMQESGARIRVIRLKNAEAESLATILNNQLNNIVKSQNASEQSATRTNGASTIMIGSDKATNALIVAAPPKDLEAIEAVIQNLDAPRKQIWVEALVVEISSGRTQELGIEWRLTDELSEDAWRGVGGTNLPLDGGQGPLQQTAANPFNTSSGLVLGIVKGTVTFGGVEYANIAALARAMETKSGVNVISKPHLLTLDNEEAEIVVGEERPFLKTAQTTDAGSTIRTYEFKDLGLTLRLTPRITEDGEIIMKIFQEIKNFIAESDVGAVTSTKRQAKTTVRISNNQIVAIGGLLKEDVIDRRTQVPCIGDLPILKYLFRSNKNTKSKTNLVIFITPHILDKQNDINDMTDKYMKSFPTPNPAEPAPKTSTGDSTPTPAP